MNGIAYLRYNKFSYGPITKNLFKNFSNKNVCLSNCINSHLKANFPKAETLFIDNCDRNYVYYNVNTGLFPNLKTIYLNSHPCQVPVLYRHFNYYQKHDHPNLETFNIYITDNWKENWYQDCFFIHGITREEFDKVLKSYPETFLTKTEI